MKWEAMEGMDGSFLGGSVLYSRKMTLINVFKCSRYKILIINSRNDFLQVKCMGEPAVHTIRNK